MFGYSKKCKCNAIKVPKYENTIMCIYKIYTRLIYKLFL